MLGKIVRIDPDDPGDALLDPRQPVRGAGRAGDLPSGLRNPWRFSFDPRTGALAIGDVGQDSFEEIDYVRDPGRG